MVLIQFWNSNENKVTLSRMCESLRLGSGLIVDGKTGDTIAIWYEEHQQWKVDDKYYNILTIV